MILLYALLVLLVKSRPESGDQVLGPSRNSHRMTIPLVPSRDSVKLKAL